MSLINTQVLGTDFTDLHGLSYFSFRVFRVIRA